MPHLFLVAKCFACDAYLVLVVLPCFTTQLYQTMMFSTNWGMPEYYSPFDKTKAVVHMSSYVDGTGSYPQYLTITLAFWIHPLPKSIASWCAHSGHHRRQLSLRASDEEVIDIMQPTESWRSKVCRRQALVFFGARKIPTDQPRVKRCQLYQGEALFHIQT